MFHGVGISISNTTLDERSTKEALGKILADQRRIGAIISQHTSIKPKNARNLFAKSRTIDAKIALASGIIHGVQDAQIPAGEQIVSLSSP